MASSWGNSWGTSWGVSWGSIITEVAGFGAGGGPGAVLFNRIKPEKWARTEKEKRIEIDKSQVAMALALMLLDE